MKHEDSTSLIGKDIKLSDLLAALDRVAKLSPTRRRDLLSAVRGVAEVLGQDPGAVRLELSAIAARLAKVEPGAHGMSAKRLANIRSDFLASVKLACFGPAPVKRGGLTEDWKALFAAHPSRSFRNGLSRLAHYASGRVVGPKDVDDAFVGAFGVYVRATSLHRNPAQLLRTTIALWNKLAGVANGDLHALQAAARPASSRRVPLEAWPASFVADTKAYCDWCRGADSFEFDRDARDRPLAPGTVHLIKNYIQTAVTSLGATGTAVEDITSLACLVEPAALKAILRHRLGPDDELKSTAYTHGLAAALVRVAAEWVKPGDAVVTELKQVLKRLRKKAPLPPGLTSKNKELLRHVDDLAVLGKLLNLPDELWREVKRAKIWDFRTLATAQVAIATELLLHVPLRVQNLVDLRFGVHLFLSDSPRAVSSLEIQPEDVKNDEPLEFDIPTALAKWLIEYRDRMAPKALGRRPEYVFVNPDGSQKTADGVSNLISRAIMRKVGIRMTPHQYRHVVAKLILDEEPGAFELVKQTLGHKSQKHTVRSYTGIDRRRALRHHQKLIDRMRDRLHGRRNDGDES
jgi:integrase